jgi:O-antigen/teichoic acid export membrane protein
LNYWNSRSKHFGRLSIARISASATTSGAPIILASTGRSGSASLVFSYLAGTFVFAGVLGVQVLKENGAKFIGYVDRSHLIANLKRYKKFPLVDSWGAFINNLSWQLPSLMLLYYFSETVVGYYSLSSRMILLPMTLVGTSIAQVFYQRSAELRSNPESLSRSVELVFRRLAAVGLFPAVILAVAGPELFSIVFGEKWLEAGRYAQILSPWMFILFISSPLTTLFATLERQELAFGVNVVILITRIAALVVGGMTQNIYVTLIVWSGTGFIIYGGLALWLLRLSHVPWLSSFRSVVQYIAYAILPALLLIVFTRTLNQYAILLLVLTLALAIIYYAIVISKDHDMRDTLLAQFSSRQIHSG